jgi:hypothetical protein
MGIRRKSARTITVEGVKYRWLTCGNDYGVDLYVELYDQPAQRLRAVFGHISVLAKLQQNGWVISPAIVAFTIRCALENGWTPGQQGKDFVLHETQMVEFEKRNSD